MNHINIVWTVKCWSLFTPVWQYVVLIFRASGGFTAFSMLWLLTNAECLRSSVIICLWRHMNLGLLCRNECGWLFARNECGWLFACERRLNCGLLATYFVMNWSQKRSRVLLDADDCCSLAESTEMEQNVVDCFCLPRAQGMKLNYVNADWMLRAQEWNRMQIERIIWL